MLQVGESAPSFTATSTRGEIDLQQLLDRGGVVLYFFPKANTPG